MYVNEMETRLEEITGVQMIGIDYGENSIVIFAGSDTNKVTDYFKKKDIWFERFIEDGDDYIKAKTVVISELIKERV